MNLSVRELLCARFTHQFLNFSVPGLLTCSMNLLACLVSLSSCSALGFPSGSRAWLALGMVMMAGMVTEFSSSKKGRIAIPERIPPHIPTGTTNIYHIFKARSLRVHARYSMHVCDTTVHVAYQQCNIPACLKSPHTISPVMK